MEKVLVLRIFSYEGVDELQGRDLMEQEGNKILRNSEPLPLLARRGNISDSPSSLVPRNKRGNQESMNPVRT
jgi:hypothetical protein